MWYILLKQNCVMSNTFSYVCIGTHFWKAKEVLQCKHGSMVKYKTSTDIQVSATK